MPLKRGIHMGTKGHRFFGLRKGISVRKLGGDKDADGEHWQRC